jgi:hypothetical protein
VRKLFDSLADSFIQGEKLYEKTQKTLPLHQTFKKGQNRSTYLPLYACADDKRPRRLDDGGQ